ncbi:hypothetical protein HDU89_001158 [Geranomyces variabilis]|nr:hypothetical protein HDU89_001158 [Geranomyces variabilis]
MRRSTFSGISRPMSHASDEPLSPAEVETLGYHQRSLSHPPPQQVVSEYDFHTSNGGGLQSPSARTWPINAAPLGGVAPSRLGPAHTHVTNGPDRDPVVAHGHAVAAAHDQQGQVGPRMRGVCGALPSADAAAANTLSAGRLTTLSHTSTYNNTTFLSSSSSHAGMYGGYPASASSLSDDDYNRRASLFDNMALTDTEGLRPQYAHQFSPVSHEQHQFDLPVQQQQSGQHQQQQQQHHQHHHNPHQHPLPHTSFHLHPLPHAAAAASALDPNPGSEYYTDQSFSGTRPRNLETRGRSLSDAGAPGDGDPVQIKRLRNTEAARRSRLRRLAHIDQLEARIAELEAENHRLILRVANLESDRAARQSQHRPGEPWGGPTAQHQLAQVGNSPNPGMAPLGAFGSMENIMSSDSPHP